MAEFHVPLTTLVLIRPGALPKTSSGKIQAQREPAEVPGRRTGAVARWTSRPRARLPWNKHGPADAPLPGVEEIRDWLRGRIAAAISVPVEEISDDEPLGHYIMDSIT